MSKHAALSLLSGWTSTEPASALCFPLPPFLLHFLPLLLLLRFFSITTQMTSAFTVMKEDSLYLYIYFLKFHLFLSPFSSTYIHIDFPHNNLLSSSLSPCCLCLGALTQSQCGQHQVYTAGKAKLSKTLTTHTYTYYTLKIPSAWVSTDKISLFLSPILSTHTVSVTTGTQRETSLFNTRANHVQQEKKSCANKCLYIKSGLEENSGEFRFRL